MGSWSVVCPTVGGGQRAVSLDNLAVTVRSAPVAGVPDLELIAPRAVYQQTRARKRSMALHGHTRDRENLAKKRAELVAALLPTVELDEPVTLRYQGAARTLELEARFAGGLDDTSSDAIVLRFEVYEPVTWRAVTATPAAKEVQGELANVQFVAQRSPQGLWSALGALDDVVAVVIAGPDGKLYAGGGFTGKVATWDGSSWTALGSGPGGEVSDLAFDAAGNLYAVGDFNGVQVWNGSSWSAVGTGGPNGPCSVLAVGGDGTLYAGGSFNSPGNNIAAWDGSSWSALGAGVDDDVSALAVALDGTLFVGGSFDNAGGNPAAKVARWDGAAWSALGAGMDGDVLGLAIGPEGTLYAVGRFTTADGGSAPKAAAWNGVAWRGLGNGLSGGDAAAVAVDADGVVYVGGNFTAAGGVTLPDSAARWNGSVWLPIGVDLPAGALVSAIHIAEDGALTLGFAGLGSVVTPAVDVIAVDGSAPTWPVVTIAGPGRVYELVNWSSGQSIYFDLTLLAGETVTLDLRPGAKTLTSSFRGNLLGTVLPGSALAGWKLLPGENYVGLYVGDATATASLEYYARYWSLDEAEV